MEPEHKLKAPSLMAWVGRTSNATLERFWTAEFNTPNTMTQDFPTEGLAGAELDTAPEPASALAHGLPGLPGIVRRAALSFSKSRVTFLKGRLRQLKERTPRRPTS